MFNSWMFYVILGLSTSTAALGWLSLSLHDDKVVAVEALKVSREAVSKLENSLNLKDKSCQINDKSTTELSAEKAALTDKVDDLSAQIYKLKSGIKKPVSPNTSGAPKNAEANTILDGTELLSDDLKRLLNSSYCLVEDCVGVPTR